jgi:hypothetical protein
MASRHQARRLEWRRAFALALPVILLGLLVPALQGRATAETPDDATIRFNHQKHLAAEVPCLFCHPGAINGVVATVPSAQKCVGCHQNLQVTSQTGQSTVDQLLQLWAEGRPLRWPKIVDLPDFVHFNHRPHLAAGKNCENCHGDVSQMTMARLAYRINMGFCLQNCHRHQEAEKRVRLMDCATCHK